MFSSNIRLFQLSVFFHFSASWPSGQGCRSSIQLLCRVLLFSGSSQRSVGWGGGENNTFTFFSWQLRQRKWTLKGIDWISEAIRHKAELFEKTQYTEGYVGATSTSRTRNIRRWRPKVAQFGSTVKTCDWLCSDVAQSDDFFKLCLLSEADKQLHPLDIQSYRQVVFGCGWC